MAIGSGGCFLQRGLDRQLFLRWDGGLALSREHSPALKLSVLVLLREVTEGKHVLPGLEHQLGGVGETVRQGAGQVIPAGFNLRGLLLSEHRVQRGGDHALMGFGHSLEQVPRGINAAALPTAALEHPPDSFGKVPVGIADHELDASQAAFLLLRRSLRLVRTDEIAPERFALAVSDLEAEQFSAPIGVNPMAATTALEQTCMARRTPKPTVEVGGIEVEVGVATGLQRPAQEGLHCRSMSSQIRLIWDLEIPLWLPRGATRASTLRFETLAT